MNTYITGSIIKELREKNGLTQAQLANRLHISDKTVSKWETGKGYPDITLLDELASNLHISIAELISGTPIENNNQSANMLRSCFYICPVCGNVIHATGDAVIQCHGITLNRAAEEDIDDYHNIMISKIEDEYYVQIQHEMTKTHYISFIAAICSDHVDFIKLYPEGSPDARIKIRGLKKILFYCNRDGLFSYKMSNK